MIVIRSIRNSHKTFIPTNKISLIELIEDEVYIQDQHKNSHKVDTDYYYKIRKMNSEEVLDMIIRELERY